MLRICIICFVLFSQIVSAQEQSWMIPPIKHKVRLAGTFGELRNNHFHTGIDIKSSNGTIGDELFSVADGFISRIKISSSGYGHALYIDHPNGFTTVYGHMEKFNQELEDFVKELQYSEQTYEFDTSFVNPTFPVKQGAYIGKMGTSGRSYGPHLHFEVRETISEVTLNPLEQGIIIDDNIAPKVEYVICNHLDDKHKKRGSTRINLIKNGNQYKPSNSTLKIPAWRIGIAVFVRDLMTGVSNKNGIYKATLKVDNEEVFEFIMDTISFDHFRCLNGHIDYDHYVENKHRLHRMYRLEGNKIPIYTENNEAVIKLFSLKPRKIDVDLSDYHGNVSNIAFSVLRDTSMQAYQAESFQYFLEQGKPHIINQQDLKIKFSEDNLYQDTYLSIEKSNDKETDYISSVYHIGDEHEAVFGTYDVYIQPNLKDPNLLEKATIVSCDDNSYTSYGGDTLNGMIGTELKSFETFVVMLDTIPPSIKATAVPLEVRNNSRLIFTIDDNLKVRGNAKDLRYNAWIDDQWILMKYDLKNKQLIHYVDEQWKVGKHVLKIEVIDDRNNVTIWEREIMKK